MFTLAVRAIILYIILLVVVRIMGKRQIAEMQPFELVLTLIIADLACIPMGENTTPIAHGIIPLLTLVVLHYFMTLLSRKSMLLRKVFNGKPAIVIDENGINYKVLQGLNMTLNDLNESLRGQGYFNFDEIAFAIVETNGMISVLPKAKNAPATCDDLNLSPPQKSLTVMLINDGKIVEENLEYLKLSKDFVYDILKKQKTPLKNVLLLSVDDSGKINFQAKNSKSVSFQAKNFGGAK